MEEINYQEIAQQLQKELEQAHIKLAHAMQPGLHSQLVDRLVFRWKKLSYMEKVYTIAMMAMALSYILESAAKIAHWKWL